jgi:hypothetical protein
MKAGVKKTIQLMTEAKQNGAELIGFPVRDLKDISEATLSDCARFFTGGLGKTHL